MGMNRTGISIPLQVTGGDAGEADLKKVQRGYKGIAKEQDASAASARKLRQEQAALNREMAAGKAAASRHGGIAAGASSFGSSIIGGPASYIGRGAGLGARAFGGVGGAAAGAGIGLIVAGATFAIKRFVDSLEHADAQVRDVAQRTGAMLVRLRSAGNALGESGVANVNTQGLSIQRLMTSGKSLDDIKKDQAYGVSPQAQALAGPKGIDTAIAAQRFGVSIDDAAADIAKNGLGKGDRYTQAAAIASRLQERRIGKDEIGRARVRSGYGGEMDRINSLSGQTSNVGIDAVTSGKAVSAAERSYAAASDPRGAALAEAVRESMDQSTVLQEIAENQSALLAFWQDMTTSEGSDRTKALDFGINSRKAIDRVRASGATN